MFLGLVVKEKSCSLGREVSGMSFSLCRRWGGSWQSCPLGLRILEKSCPLGREVTGKTKRCSLGRGSSLDDGEPASAMASLCLT